MVPLTASNLSAELSRVGPDAVIAVGSVREQEVLNRLLRGEDPNGNPVTRFVTWAPVVFDPEVESWAVREERPDDRWRWLRYV